jgi:hypothetical protein
MRLEAPTLLALTLVAFPLPTPAQDATATFAPPDRLKAGDAFHGEGRLIPSPVYHDVNGDGLADIVVGDLRGRLTVAIRKPGGAIAYEAETPLQDELGKDIDFHNW